MIKVLQNCVDFALNANKKKLGGTYPPSFFLRPPLLYRPNKFHDTRVKVILSVLPHSTYRTVLYPVSTSRPPQEIRRQHSWYTGKFLHTPLLSLPSFDHDLISSLKNNK